MCVHVHVCIFLQKQKNTELFESCFRYLATGMSFRSMAFSFRMGDTTIREVVYSTCSTVWESLRPLVMPEPNEELWKGIERRFCEKWNFPNAAGALDRKHVVIEAPPNSGADFFCKWTV